MNVGKLSQARLLYISTLFAIVPPWWTQKKYCCHKTTTKPQTEPTPNRTVHSYKYQLLCQAKWLTNSQNSLQQGRSEKIVARKNYK